MMIRPIDSSFLARYYDGKFPVSHDASVEIRDAGLLVSVEGAEPEPWPISGIEFTADGAYGEPVRMESRTGETLIVESHDFVEALRQHGIQRRAPVSINLRSWPAIIACGVAIAILASIYYAVGVTWAADVSARVMPMFLEEKLGKSVLSLLAPESSRCAVPAHGGLQAMVDRLRAASGSPYRFRLIYVNQPIVNAFAAPGGYIVVFRGLLDEAQTPEEFAGVLAHEMEHVILRHSSRAIAREFSGRALLALMAIDSSGTPTAIQAGARLANLSYQRSDEEEADLAGARLLAKAGMPTGGLTTFLRRMQVDPRAGEPSFKYLSTHPAMAERIEKLRSELSRNPQPTKPLMTPAEWYAARQVCPVQ